MDLQIELRVPRHQFFVSLHLTRIEGRHLVMEYMPGGDFLMLLLQKAPLREDETRFYLAEMINGIDECHKLGFMHRDIKVMLLLTHSLYSLIIFLFQAMDI